MKTKKLILEIKNIEKCASWSVARIFAYKFTKSLNEIRGWYTGFVHKYVKLFRNKIYEDF